MSVRQVIIADDLTGALDSAAAWRPHTRVTVLLDLNALDTAEAEVIAFDTNTRHGTSKAAAAIVTEHTTQALRLSASIYKKIDSTLRGNTAVEIAAAFQAFARGESTASVLIAPAFPDTGRTVVDGVVRVDGQPLANGHGDLRKRLLAAGMRVVLIDLKTVRRGAAAIKAAYEAHIAHRAEAVVLDAEIEADLDNIHDALNLLEPPVLPVGSAGLLRAAARRNASEDVVRHVTDRRADGHTLIVLGSYSERARAQRTRLQASRIPMVALRAPFGDDEQQMAACELSRHLADNDALLCPDPATPVERSHAPMVAMALASTTRRILAGQRPPAQPSGLILTGGETARAVLTAAAVDRLTVQGEIEPGVVQSSTDRLGGLTIVTKAGAFGDAETLERARRALMPPTEHE